MIRANRLIRLAGVSTAAIVSLASALHAQTQPIKLKLRDGDFVVQGTLINFDGKTFVIDDRAYGRMTFEAARFACIDGPCPAAAATAPQPAAANVDDKTEVRLSLRGSQSLTATLAPALVRAFANDSAQPATRLLGLEPMQVEFKLARAPQKAPLSISIDPKPSASGLDELAKGFADIALSDRAPSESEQRALAALSKDLRGPDSEHIVALDGIVVATHPSRGQMTLTVAELQGVLSGTIRDWSELKSTPGPIELHVPSVTSSAMDQVRRFILQPANKPLSAEAKIVGSVVGVAEAVARSPNAIGITARSATDNVTTVPLRGQCGLTMQPSVHAIKAGDYPLTRRLYFYTAQEPQKPAIRSFVSFAKSEKGQAVALEQNFVSQALDYMPDAQHAERFEYAVKHAASMKREADWQTYARDLTNARRISATFRFPSGRSEIDAKTDQDLTRLAAVLADPQFAGREIMIVGYADAIGRYDLNTTLALNRAQKIRAALLQRGGAALQGRTLTARGHGPHAPVLCNDDPVAQEINRRVEIWVRN